jgi:uncharacterized protein (DUF3084 family)
MIASLRHLEEAQKFLSQVPPETPTQPSRQERNRSEVFSCTTSRARARCDRFIPIRNLRAISGKVQKPGNVGQNRRKTFSVFDWSLEPGIEQEPDRGRLWFCPRLAAHPLRRSAAAWRKSKP